MVRAFGRCPLILISHPFQIPLSDVETYKCAVSSNAGMLDDGRHHEDGWGSFRMREGHCERLRTPRLLRVGGKARGILMRAANVRKPDVEDDEIESRVRELDARLHARLYFLQIQ